MSKEREQELDEARITASRAFYAATEAYDQRRRELETEARARVNAEQVGVAYFAAQEDQQRTEREWRAEHDANVVAQSVEVLTQAGLKEGDIVEEWRQPQRYWQPVQGFAKTGEKAVVQVYRSGDPLPAGYRYAIDIGNIIVRAIKKDGKPSTKAERWNPSWVKEGTTHPLARAT